MDRDELELLQEEARADEADYHRNQYVEKILPDLVKSMWDDFDADDRALFTFMTGEEATDANILEQAREYGY